MSEERKSTSSIIEGENSPSEESIEYEQVDSRISESFLHILTLRSIFKLVKMCLSTVLFCILLVHCKYELYPWQRFVLSVVSGTTFLTSLTFFVGLLFSASSRKYMKVAYESFIIVGQAVCICLMFLNKAPKTETERQEKVAIIILLFILVIIFSGDLLCLFLYKQYYDPLCNKREAPSNH